MREDLRGGEEHALVRVMRRVMYVGWVEEGRSDVPSSPRPSARTIISRVFFSLAAVCTLIVEPPGLAGEPATAGPPPLRPVASVGGGMAGAGAGVRTGGCADAWAWAKGGREPVVAAEAGVEVGVCGKGWASVEEGGEEDEVGDA